MMNLKPIILVLCILFSTVFGDAQSTEAVLATATGFTFKPSDLSSDGKKFADQQVQLIAAHRKDTFNKWVFELLLEMEAGSRSISAERIEAEAIASAAKPTEMQIKAVYDQNRQNLSNRPLQEVRPSIVEFLARDAAGKQLALLGESLRAKYKYTELKDVGIALKAAEIAAQIGTRQITVGEFEIANRIELYNHRARIYEQIRGDLEDAIFVRLLEAEAKKRNIDASGVIAAEVTNKLKEYTDYERVSLEDALQERLFAAYAVKFNLTNLEPQVLSVSADDDPMIGNANATVTVVAFVDFQCSACAAFSPMLKSVVNEFGANARLVIRDYPLTSIHKDAMQAALAGYAARQQGKFFEMADLMYRNQSDLGVESLRGFATQLGLNLAKFDGDMKSPAAAAEIKKDVHDGDAYGVSGTPTIFVNGVQIHRLASSRVREAIKKALK